MAFLVEVIGSLAEPLLTQVLYCPSPQDSLMAVKCNVASPKRGLWVVQSRYFSAQAKEDGTRVASGNYFSLPAREPRSVLSLGIAFCYATFARPRRVKNTLQSGDP